MRYNGSDEEGRERCAIGYCVWVRVGGRGSDSGVEALEEGKEGGKKGRRVRRTGRVWNLSLVGLDSREDGGARTRGFAYFASAARPHDHDAETGADDLCDGK